MGGPSAGVQTETGFPLTALVGFGGKLRDTARDAARLWRGLTGEDAYDKYRAHFEASHRGDSDARSLPGSGGEALMTEREFWRDQSDRQDHNPQGRCC